METQQSISDWAEEAFGPVGSNARVAARANEEMAELLRALTADDRHPKAAEEMADVVIVLARLATRLGVELTIEVERKMAVNRAREWKRDGTGHGYHVRDRSIVPRPTAEADDALGVPQKWREDHHDQ
jgi:NTP pyrophosphatase (non-canonical NTP hydrolase)